MENIKCIECSWRPQNRTQIKPQQPPQQLPRWPKNETTVVLTYEERKELGRLEKEIQKLNEKKTKLSAEYNNFEQLSQDRIVNLAKELEQIDEQIETKEMRWLELAELA